MSPNINSNSLFPDRLASDSEKETDAYGINYAKAIYHHYKNDEYSTSMFRDRFILNRKYAEGLQDINKYKDLLGLNGDSSYLNLDFSVVSIIPKFVDLLVGELINQEFRITCNAID